MASDPNNLYGMTFHGGDLPEDRFTVVEARGVEELSRPYRFDLVLQVRGGDATSVEELLGGPAALALWDGADITRTLQGVVSRVEIEPNTGADQHFRARVRLVPRLALLRRNRNSRIFQDKKVQEIATRVLDESGVACQLQLSRTYNPRVYCVQYEESDLDFVERLAAEEGWFYYLEYGDYPAGHERVVFCDDVRLLAPVSGNPTLRFHDSGGIVEEEGDVSHFALRRRVRPRSSLMRAYDYTRPSLDLAAAAETHAAGPHGELDPALLAQRFAPVPSVQVTSSPIAGLPAGQGLAAAPSTAPPVERDEPFLRRYEHHLRYDGQPLDPGVAQQALEQHRSRAVTAEGDSRSRRLAPGRWMELASSPIAAQNQRYVIRRVEHSAGRPTGPSPLGGNPGEIYRNRFTCTPIEAQIRVPRPARKVQQVVETATVVGPPGQEIHTDSLGRIKVQFHWDRQGRKNDHSSVWIRVMHAWAGTGWGFQFLPRVGMEVVVGFLGGDMDRPLIMGSVYNAERPLPFALPREKTKSGIRTESTRGGGGHNELSFEDRKGYERVYVHAEKDLETVAENHHTARVGANMTEHVRQNRFSVVGANQIEAVTGDVTESVGGHHRSSVTGDRHVQVQGDTHVLHQKDLKVDVQRAVKTTFGADHHHAIAGQTLVSAGGDVTLQVAGALTAVVGSQDAPKSIAMHVEGRADLSASQEIQLVAPDAITLQCGESFVRLGPSSIEISSPQVVVRSGDASITTGDDNVKVRAPGLIGLKSDDKVGLWSSGALVVLASDAKIDGSQVKLKAPAGSFSDEEAQEGELTTIEVVDEEGNPVPNERFRIRLSGGREISGVLDAGGKATVRFSGEGELELPEVGRVESA